MSLKLYIRWDGNVNLYAAESTDEAVSFINKQFPESKEFYCIEELPLEKGFLASINGITK